MLSTREDFSREGGASPTRTSFIPVGSCSCLSAPPAPYDMPLRLTVGLSIHHGRPVQPHLGTRVRSRPLNGLALSHRQATTRAGTARHRRCITAPPVTRAPAQW